MIWLYRHGSLLLRRVFLKKCVLTFVNYYSMKIEFVQDLLAKKQGKGLTEEEKNDTLKA